jgi:nucleoside-diphosphate-sugar epimerase
MNILVTGATGFIGQFLCNLLVTKGFTVRGTLLASENSSALTKGVEAVPVGQLCATTPWLHALTGIDTIIHLAARVHVMDEYSTSPLEEYRRVNSQGTAQLARQAAEAGVRRLVFISSIKVNGEETPVPYSPDSPPHPSDPYGISKWEAEQALRTIEAETGLEVVIIRPTLVYGPEVKGNFLTMMKILSKGIPLPLASVSNKRSLIYVGNLVDFLATCAVHPNAAGQTYLISDGEDISTPELIRRTAAALGLPVRLFPVSVPLLAIAAKLAGKSGAVNRLTGSLTVDSSKARQELAWQPPFTMAEGLAETAAWFGRPPEPPVKLC